MIRIDKYISSVTGLSRSQVKDIIKKGEVSVNGQIITKPEFKLDEKNDTVIYEDECLAYEKYEYYMFNKPAGCISATTDKSCATVIDYFSNVTNKELFPVGRLDKDTEGLLILTNDGELAHNLLSPKKHIPKTYFVILDREVSEDVIGQFEAGIDIGEEKLTLPAGLIISKQDKKEAYITITEGKYHQVKRMFKVAGYEVTYLKRISMGGINLDENLGKGQFRKLTNEELFLLKNGKNKK